MSDIDWMRRAIRLAMHGRGRVEPNPLVGCVIVRDGQVIGEGFHQHFGGPHAEPQALAACAAAGQSAAGATAYVTLEPCCHTQKKTPPCVPKLIEAQLARVVIGCLDPNPAVDGRGAAQLRTVGVEVTAPLLECAAKQLIAPFLARVRHKRPYVTLKWAESANGRVAGPGGTPVRISNDTSTRWVHELRARCDAIMVGIGTVLKDDPLLTARGVESHRVLRRMVLDSRCRIPIGSRLIRTAGERPLIIYTSPGYPNEMRRVFLPLGVEVCEIPADTSGRLLLSDLLGAIDVEVTHLLVEPGPTLARGLLDEGLADRLWVIRSPVRIEDATAPVAAVVPAGYLKTGEADLDGDRLTEYLNPTSDVFFGDLPSPDLVMATGCSFLV